MPAPWAGRKVANLPELGLTPFQQIDTYDGDSSYRKLTNPGTEPGTAHKINRAASRQFSPMKKSSSFSPLSASAQSVRSRRQSLDGTSGSIIAGQGVHQHNYVDDRLLTQLAALIR
jgi:hypothetical protein